MRHIRFPLVAWWSVAVLWVALLGIGGALASGEYLRRSVLPAGGHVVSGGGITLHSVVGEPVAGPVTNGMVRLRSGFVPSRPTGPGTPPATPTPGGGPPHTIYLPSVQR